MVDIAGNPSRATAALMRPETICPYELEKQLADNWACRANTGCRYDCAPSRRNSPRHCRGALRLLLDRARRVMRIFVESTSYRHFLLYSA